MATDDIPHRERILKLAALETYLVHRSIGRARKRELDLIRWESARLMDDISGKEVEILQSVHHKRELDYVKGLYIQVKDASPVYLPDPIRVIVTDYATPQVLVAFEHILKKWTSSTGDDHIWHTRMAELGLYNIKLYNVVRAIFEPLEYRYGGDPVPYTPHQEEICSGSASFFTALWTAIHDSVKELYPDADVDNVLIREHNLDLAITHTNGDLPIWNRKTKRMDPLGRVILTTMYPIICDQGIPINIVSIWEEFPSPRDLFIVSGCKVRQAGHSSTIRGRNLANSYMPMSDFVFKATSGFYGKPETPDQKQGQHKRKTKKERRLAWHQSHDSGCLSGKA
jgi:hypothetical protein